MPVLPSKPLYPVRVTKQLWPVPIEHHRAKKVQGTRQDTTQDATDQDCKPQTALSTTALKNHKILKRLRGTTSRKTPSLPRPPPLGDGTKNWVGTWNQDSHRRGVYAAFSNRRIYFMLADTTMFSEKLPPPEDPPQAWLGNGQSCNTEYIVFGEVAFEGQYKGQSRETIKQMLVAKENKRKDWRTQGVKTWGFWCNLSYSH